MADQSSASVNVHECSWADIQVTLNVPGGANVPVVDIEGWKWERKNERAISMGTSGRPKKRTRGAPSYAASATATRGGWMMMIEEIEKAAEALGQVRGDQVIIGGIDFDVLIQHTPLGDSRIYAVKLKGCSLDGDSSDMKQGNEADMIELVLNPLEIATKSSSGKWLVIA
jgi:hypothetical protein